MNKILKFERVYYEKYNTIRINIENGIFSLKEHGKALQTDKTKYGYKKAVCTVGTTRFMRFNKILGESNK